MAYTFNLSTWATDIGLPSFRTTKMVTQVSKNKKQEERERERLEGLEVA